MSKEIIGIDPYKPVLSGLNLTSIDENCGKGVEE